MKGPPPIARPQTGRPRRVTRRRFLLGTILSTPFLVGADAWCLEPHWVKTRGVRLRGGAPACRLVHITDIHHKGNRRYLQSVVRRINALSPDFVCFTGDLIEEARYLPEALEILTGLKVPLYAVPGNHDYWSSVAFDDIAKCCAATGGAWLLDSRTVIRNGKLTILGAASVSFRHASLQPNPTTRNILLMHYPAWIKELGTQQYDLILAGHSHGGQVRIPWYGPIMVPFGVEQYDLGLFRTPCGPLYVNPGLGWFPVAIRFNCRPEITVIEL